MVADKFIGEPEIREAVEATETVVPDDKSIAVLPFVNMSDDKDYFADGLSEELLNLLAKIPDLKVIGRTSSFAFKGKNEDLRAIGDALGVSTVLEGSVRRSGDRLRITAQLINTDDGSHLWSDTYDREMADIFQIQDDVAGAIIEALQLHLVSDASDQANRPTQNTEAYALYLEALAVFREVDDPLVAIEVLDRALALDPSFAKAHERKAIYYWTTGSYTMDSPTAQGLVHESASAALAIDPTLIGAQTFLVTADPNNWTWSKELLAIERGMHNMPNDDSVLYAYCWDLSFVGYHREALSCVDRLIELEPLWTWSHFLKGQILSALGEREEARIAWQKAAELGAFQASNDAIVDHLLHGEDEEAIGLLETMSSKFGSKIMGLDGESSRSFVESARNPNSGVQFLRQAVVAMVEDATNFLGTTEPYAWYLAFGDLDAFYDFVMEMNDIDSSWANSQNVEYSGRYFKLSGFAADPRFIEIYQRWGMLELWEERGPPDDCEKIDGNWVCR
jgi:TolB-like protein